MLLKRFCAEKKRGLPPQKAPSSPRDKKCRRPGQHRAVLASFKPRSRLGYHVSTLIFCQKNVGEIFDAGHFPKGRAKKSPSLCSKEIPYANQILTLRAPG
jgi:hypothetical protein